MKSTTYSQAEDELRTLYECAETKKVMTAANFKCSQA